MRAYREGILLGGETSQSDMDMALVIVDTIESKVALFLRDKTHQLDFRQENAKQDF